VCTHDKVWVWVIDSECMHAYMYVRVCMNADVCMHVHIHAYMHGKAYLQPGACDLLGRSYMHTCIHAYMHTCIHAYMHGKAYLHSDAFDPSSDLISMTSFPPV
jgi:hypothetical protein